ncbi:MAG: pyridoxal phosphate-dependent aminotransferase [Acidobacteria bacterium]|nr:pyridoxal phosphate-dependent aminotransferase [Acidobacteriota bacterium]
MFSSRLHWDMQPNSLAQLLEAKRRSGAAILDLTESNPTRAGFAYPEQPILQALAQPGSLLYEPSPAGLHSAREAVAEYYRSRGHRVEPSRILLTASTSEAYACLFKLLADPADEILVPRPSYPLFDYLAALESVRPIPYPLRYHGAWSLELEALAAAITPRTRAIVLVHPNNPTGSFVKREELERLIPICQEQGLAILSDEVFSDYAIAPDRNRVDTLAAEARVLTFCLSGLSKVAGLPQMKLGWVVISGPPAIEAVAREHLELIADTYLSVGAPVQHALPELLAIGEKIREQIQQRVLANWNFLRMATDAGSACSLLDAEGGWYAILQLPRTRSEEQWCLALLEKDNVLVQPGYFYDFESEAYLVVSLLTPREPFTEGIRRLQALARTA